jgi:hypothetical protein
LLALAAGPASGEVQRLEAVGVVPLKAGQQRSGALEAAIQAGLREAVSRVARNLLLEADASEGADSEIEKALGKRMVAYTSRFRILDDQGERAAMFTDDPKATSEYVVVVEVFVEADRVEQRLIEAGLLQRALEAGSHSRVELELQGLEEYGAYTAARTLLGQLGERAGVRSVTPRLFESGKAMLDVELDRGAGGGLELFDRMAAQAPPELGMRAVELEYDRVVVAVEWSAPPDAEPGSR